MPLASPSRGALVRGLSLFGCVALVAGNMLGTSLYTLPAPLAKAVGPLGIVAWLVTAAGFLLVAMVYATLGVRYPRSGGPYVFAREAFGEFVGFLTVWMYWLSAVVGNAAIVTGGIGYAIAFSGTLAGSPILQFALAQITLWGLCWANVRGIKYGAHIQQTVIVCNIIPLTFLGYALFHFNSANLHPFAPHGFGALAAGAALIVWAYSGIESATVPAEEVEAPERTIKLGTYLGYGMATTIFLIAAVAVVGVLPNASIASTPRPVEQAVSAVMGPTAGMIVSLAAIVATVGVLNGWTIMVGRIPLSAAEDGLFFRRFASVHPRYGTPHFALIVGTLIASVLLTLYLIPNATLLGVFNFTVLLANLGTLVPYLANAAAAIKLARTQDGMLTRPGRIRLAVASVLALAFLAWATYGVGSDVVKWGLVTMAAGVPLYFVFRRAGKAGLEARRQTT